MRARKKRGWLLLLLLPLIYVAYFLEPVKPRAVVHEFVEANHRQDLEGLRRLCRDRVQHGWDGDWFDNTPEEMLTQLRWDRSPAPNQPIRYELASFIDPRTPGYRFVGIRNLDFDLGGYFVRLRW